MVTDEPGLVLPRPDLVRRAYMLGPMAELAPDLVHPTSGSTMRELWESFDRDAHADAARGPRLATRERDGLMSRMPPAASTQRLRPPSTAITCPVTYGASVAR